MLSNRTVFFSYVIRKKLIHGSAVFNCSTKITTLELKKAKGFDGEKLFDYSNSLIKPYLNVEKLNLLKDFYQTKNESTCTYNFVIDEYVAKNITDKIMSGKNQRKGIMVEGNPGLGLITINLINSGASHILVFDNSEIQDVSLTQIIDKYPEKITKKTINMNKNTDGVLLNSLDFGRQLNAPVTIIGISTSFYLIRGLAVNFVKYKLWRSNFEIFLVTSSTIMKCLKQSGSQKQLKFFIYCIFNLFFNLEEIEKYPREAFLPLSKQMCEPCNEEMHLIRLSLNTNRCKIFKEEELKEFFVFLKILSSSSTNFVIPALEKWLPNCGPYLISKGVAMTTEVREITYEETIHLYHHFKECEGYSDLKTSISHIFPTWTAD